MAVGYEVGIRARKLVDRLALSRTPEAVTLLTTCAAELGAPVAARVITDPVHQGPGAAAGGRPVLAGRVRHDLVLQVQLVDRLWPTWAEFSPGDLGSDPIIVGVVHPHVRKDAGILARVSVPVHAPDPRASAALLPSIDPMAVGYEVGVRARKLVDRLALSRTPEAITLLTICAAELGAPVATRVFTDPVHQGPVPKRTAARKPRCLRQLLRPVGAAPQQRRRLGKCSLAALHQEDEEGEERDAIATEGHNDNSRAARARRAGKKRAVLRKPGDDAAGARRAVDRNRASPKP